jgi:hypothetical protein
LLVPAPGRNPRQRCFVPAIIAGVFRDRLIRVEVHEELPDDVVLHAEGREAADDPPVVAEENKRRRFQRLS